MEADAEAEAETAAETVAEAALLATSMTAKSSSLWRGNVAVSGNEMNAWRTK